MATANATLSGGIPSLNQSSGVSGQGGMDELLPLVKQLTNPDQVSEIVRRFSQVVSLSFLYRAVYISYSF